MWDGFLFEFMCLQFWKRLVWKLITLCVQTGAQCMCYKKLLINASMIWKIINFVKPSLDSLFGIPYLHMFIYNELTWEVFLSKFMCFKFWKMLMWKLHGFSTQTHAKWVHKVVNECIMQLEKNKLCEALLGFPVWHSIFTYVYSQEINLRWLLVWVHVP